ncbi:MAG TPA: phosphomannomutase/phosphoglucomutase [Polyangiaceae bacterium]|nr:phosphomannomutase/phosphoglucomutase [Polyangiaceae bacterium]
MSNHIYREYDIRGVADRDLTSPVVKAIGRGLGTMLRPSQSKGRYRVAVGRDCRVSGPRISSELIAGLRRAGADVVDIGVGPTPYLYFAAHHLGTDGSVMVTGSHNPGDENGLKIMRGKASFFGDDIRALGEMVETGSFGPDGDGGFEQTNLEDAYVQALTKSIRIDNPSIRVVVDAGNGAAGPLGLKALRAAGLDPVPLFCEMDGTFPNHHPDPTVPKNLVTLMETMKKERAVVGIAFDGDGDRLGVVDQNLTPVWGDRLLALFAREMLPAHPAATVIGEVKCSQTLFDDIARHGGRPIMWKTGHSLIKTKMKEEHALLAGEMSGHFFFADRYFGYDDGIYAALRVLEIVARAGRPIGELLADLPVTVSTPEIRVDCPDALKASVVAAVRDHFRGRYETTEIDGARITHPDGAWALVRASNTGPIIVVRFEAPTEARLAEVRAEVETVLDAARAKLGAPRSGSHA